MIANCRMANLRQMYKTGLFINDFALHDSSRDLVLASTQQAAELKLLLDQVCIDDDMYVRRERNL